MRGTRASVPGMTRVLGLSCVLWAAAAMPACQGAIGDGAGLPGPSQSPGPSVPAPRPTATPSPTTPPPPPELPAFEPAPASMRRLTRVEYGHTVRDLLGLEAPVDLEQDTVLHGFTTVAASALTVSERAADQYEAAALDLAERLFDDAARRDAFVGCAPASPDDPCVRAFIERFGRRAWRRALTTEEVDRWQGVARTVHANLRDTAVALELVTAGLLQSPHFLYRVEIGTPDPADPTQRRYTGDEMASRLSYLIWGSTPDDALLDAAARGELDDVAGITRQAQRMLEAPRAKGALARFFAEHLKLDRLDGITKDAATFPQMTSTLPRAMRTEIERIIDDVVFEQQGDVRDIFDSRTTFVNEELARVYNMPGVTGEALTRVPLPDNSPRAGILTTAGFLALNAHASVTSPTLRGRFIRQSLLCQDIPPPPANVVTELPEPDPNAGPQTLRERLEALHLAVDSCAACHRLMDPLGFGFESFDAIGAYRTRDNGLPIDTTGVMDGRSFRNARELAARVKESPAVASCVARMTYRYATGQLEGPAQARVVKALTDAFTSRGHRFQDLILAVVTSDGFRLAAAQE